MFLKFRTHRAEKKASRKNKKLSKESPPDLEPVLTMTMSQDEEEEPCEKQVMENALNQMRQLSEKHQQVLNVQRQLSEKEEELREFKAEMEVLKSASHTSLTDKDKEMTEARSQFEKALSEKENEIVGLKSELVETKDKLVEVSSVLIKCQHELHEQSNSFWRFTSGWV